MNKSADSALIDTLLREQAQLHDRIGRDSVRLAAYARLVGNQGQQISLLTAQRDSLQIDRDSWRNRALAAPTLQIPSLGLPDAADCAIGALAGAALGELVADEPLLTIGAASVGCVVNALR